MPALVLADFEAKPKTNGVQRQGQIKCVLIMQLVFGETADMLEKPSMQTRSMIGLAVTIMGESSVSCAIVTIGEISVTVDDAITATIRFFISAPTRTGK